jgi:ubiquitin carboxyl-terminal hydrolase 14
MQQDAEEFYNRITESIKEAIGRDEFGSLLGIELEEQLTCAETDLEAPVTRHETVNKIVCTIQGGPGSVGNVDHIQEGIKLWLEGSLEKNSSVLGRNALWNKKARVSKLPRYLCFQFMRFFWKATPESADHQGVKCKILRAVSFPEVTESCVYNIL